MIESPLTFAPAALDRAQHLRKDPDLAGDSLLLWRGKLLMSASGLVRLPVGHPARSDPGAEQIFLGCDDGTPLFATNISLWTPEQDPSDAGAFFDNSQIIHPACPEAWFAEPRMMLADLDAWDADAAATALALTNWHRTHGHCSRCGARSEMELAGWQRRCSACDALHFPRTDPVVIVLALHGNDVLLGRSPHWPDGFFSLLAGFVEPGETIEDAARREVMEEVGVRLGPVDYLACQPWPFPNSLMFGMKSEAQSVEITCDPEEIAEALWASREEVAAILDGAEGRFMAPRIGSIARHLLGAWVAGRL